MRRMLSVAGALLGLHILFFVLSDGYRDVAFHIGMLLGHGNDISDIPDVEGKGFTVLAIAIVGLGIVFERLWSRSRHGTRGRVE
jgi:hypothetical protein